MGATVWQRDGEGGKTFSTGVQRPGKRKHVWKREDQQAERPQVPDQRSVPSPAHPRPPAAPTNGYKRPCANGASSAPHPAPSQPRPAQAAADSEDWDGEVVFDVPDSDAGTPGSGSKGHQQPQAGRNGSFHVPRQPHHSQSNGLQGQDLYGNSGHACGASSSSSRAGIGQAMGREQWERAAAERKVRAAQEELEALKQTIAEREQRLAREQSEAAAREAGERWQREELARRKSRLEAGFAEAFRLAKQTAAAEIAKAGRASVNSADAAEVARVLAARDDYDVLRVQPGTSSAAVRRRYRDMAMALHPDKCKIPEAKAAFQRLVRAYQDIVKSAA